MLYASKVKNYHRFVFGLRSFLKDTISLEEAEETVRNRMENREENFLKIVEKGVYGYNKSPYLKLLKLADYRFSDVKRLVDDEGLEGALRRLREDGVYISYEESKGKKPIIRKGKKIEVEPLDFHNPYISSYYEGRSSATRSSGTVVRVNFKYLEQKAVCDVLLHDIYDIQETPIGVWLPPLPVLAGINRILTIAKIGKIASKWFTHWDIKSDMVSRNNFLLMNTVHYEGRILGKKMPKPEFMDPNNALNVSKWIDSMLKETGECCFYAVTNQAVRICLEARKHGVDLDGTKFIVGSEPVTLAKRNEIESTGATVIPFYVMAECGHIGYGCKNPENEDEVHFFKDSLALIQHKRRDDYSETEVDSMLLTSLLSASPRILFNLETDDFGIVESRDCGCKFQDLGFTEHIHNIRSFSKLTGEGVTLLGTDAVKIIEEDLPRLYGGGSLDYQLLEKEDRNGITKVIINVSPDVGEINEEELKKNFLELMNPIKRNAITIAQIWENVDTIQVERNYPIRTNSGKILPLHIIKS